MWVAYISGGFYIRYFIVNFALTSTVLAPTVVEHSVTIYPFINVTGIYNSTQAEFFFEITNDTVGNYFVEKNTGNLTGTVGTTSVLLRSVGIYSKAFVHNSISYLVLTHQSDLQSTYFLCNSSGQVVAKIAPSLGGGLSTIGLLAEVNLITSNVINFAFEFKDFVTSVNGDVTTQTGVNSAFLTFGEQIQNEVIGNNLHMSGGIVSMYDGQNIVEKGFNLYPEDLSATLYTGGGGLGIGKYQYCSVYEWTDGQGQIHRSAPSVPVELDTSTSTFYSNGSLTASVYTPLTANYSDKDYIAPGFTITGPGISGVGTFVHLSGVTGLAILPAPTNNSGNYAITSGKGFSGITTIGSDIVAISRNNIEYYSANITSGSSTIYINTDESIPLGSKVYVYVNGTTTPQTAYVTSQTGNAVTISTPFSITANGIQLYSIGSITGSITNGSAVMTGVSSSDTTYLQVGQEFSLNNPTRTGFVVSKTSTTITFDSNFNNNTSAAQLMLYPFRYPLKNETYNENQSTLSFGGSFIVKEVYNNGTIKVNFHSIYNNTIYFSSTSSIFGAITFPTLRITEKKSQFGKSVIALYRTTVNGTVFYRVDPPTSQIINDTTVDSITYTDKISDDVLVGNEQLYTTGGEIENISPPASSVVGTYKNRILLRSDEDPLTFWYSKKVLNNTPPEFTDSFTTRVPERGGDIKALQQMDDKLIIFKEDLIYVQVGDGPSASGINNDFSDPQLITSDNGCANKKSVIVIPTGLIYQSSKGFYLLDRSLNMSYIGADVESYNSDSVTSAKLMEDINQVRFTLLSGVVLVYDYYLSQWDVFPNLSAADSVIYNNKFTYILPSGVVRSENTTFMDDTSFIPMKLESGWLNLAGLQGYQRVYKILILGEYKSPHSLYVELFRDFNETAFQQTTIPVLTAPTKYQFRLFLDIQKMESLKIRITELQDGPSYGEGFELSSIALAVGIKRGLNKVSEDESFG